jgi:hypothetical protein
LPPSFEIPPHDIFSFHHPKLTGSHAFSFRPLTVRQLIHLLDHALRLKSPQHWDETIVRPLLLKQYQPSEHHKQDRASLKEWPVLWMHYTLHALIKGSLPALKDPQVDVTCQNWSLLLQAYRFRHWNNSFMQGYWMQSTLGFSDAMLQHPDGVTHLNALWDVLDCGDSYFEPVEEPSVNQEASPSDFSAFVYSVHMGITPQWGRIAHYLWSEATLYARFYNPQFKEVPWVLTQTALYFEAYSSQKACRTLASFQQLSQDWESLQTGFHPVHTIVLVEGMTEEVLLPALLKGRVNTEGIQVQGCGGKTAMLSHYQRMRPWFKGRFRLVLDADAQDVIAPLEKQLQSSDTYYLIPEGSIEDCYELPLFIKAINQVRIGFPPVTLEHFQAWCRDYKMSSYNRLQVYERFWLAQGLDRLDKTFLAQTIVQTCLNTEEKSLAIPKGLRSLVDFMVN